MKLIANRAWELALRHMVLAFLVVTSIACSSGNESLAAELPTALLAQEQQRIELCRQITPATIAIFDRPGKGGGSGVIVSNDGFALTNFHVVAPCGPYMKCGLADGSLVDAVLVGYDAVGDVALIKLIADRNFPAATWGNSDDAQTGDPVLVAGNPFMLADDFKPTITAGILSGVRRYQHPAGGLLEYTDCLQTDASINPGNSGGPLYDFQGRLIGINGRASFEKRGRVNVGVGYAISVNQARRFLSHLKSGRSLDHGTLGLTVRTIRQRAVVAEVDEGSDAARRGIRYGDTITRVGNRAINSANDVQNIVGTFPPHWTLPVEIDREGLNLVLAIRLEAVHSETALGKAVAKQIGGKSVLKHAEEEIPAELSSLYQARDGFANYYFNEITRDDLLVACPQRSATSDETIELAGRDRDGKPFSINLTRDRGQIRCATGQDWIDAKQSLVSQSSPAGTGGLLAALICWQEFAFANDPNLDSLIYLGQLPYGPNLQLGDCLRASRDGGTVEFYLSLTDHSLRAVRWQADEETDACLLMLDDHRTEGLRSLPHRLTVHHAGEVWNELQVGETHEAGRPVE